MAKNKSNEVKEKKNFCVIINTWESYERLGATN